MSISAPQTGSMESLGLFAYCGGSAAEKRQFTALLVTHDVGEAVALADRIIVIEHGDIALDIPVNLPRPRARGSAAFAALEDRVLRQVLQLPPTAEAEAVYVETDASIPDL